MRGGLRMRWIELRKKAYRQLEPTAWPGNGLSPVNFVLILLIIAAVMEAVLDTEPSISAGNEHVLNGMEFGFGIIFLIEYLARVWVAVDNPRYTRLGHPRLHYIFTPLAIIDLLAVVPALFAFGGAPSLVLRFFRVLRMLRLAKLGRTSKAWVLIREAVYSKRREFTLIMGMVLFMILAAGSLMYWAEGDAQPDKFGSIPRAMWWAIITLTTVGYGDVYPITPLGRIFAGLIAIAGVMLIALPTGLFAASFTDAMERERIRDEEERAARARRRERLQNAKP
ncbi:MAG TPA: ion transporter [Sphingomicrobium sp.]|nr:ion transporter [Sphingomicrobium sp.]